MHIASRDGYLISDFYDDALGPSPLSTNSCLLGVEAKGPESRLVSLGKPQRKVEADDAGGVAGAGSS